MLNLAIVVFQSGLPFAQSSHLVVQSDLPFAESGHLVVQAGLPFAQSSYLVVQSGLPFAKSGHRGFSIWTSFCSIGHFPPLVSPSFLHYLVTCLLNLSFFLLNPALWRHCARSSIFLSLKISYCSIIISRRLLSFWSVLFSHVFILYIIGYMFIQLAF